MKPPKKGRPRKSTRSRVRRVPRLELPFPLKHSNIEWYRSWLLQKRIPLHVGKGNIQLLQKGISCEGQFIVSVLVNGKRIYFYKSSGENSGYPGKWFPCRTIEVIGNDFWFEKLAGHPSKEKKIPPRFPKWVEKVAIEIERNKQEKRIKWYPAENYELTWYCGALDALPHLETVKETQGPYEGMFRLTH